MHMCVLYVCVCARVLWVGGSVCRTTLCKHDGQAIRKAWTQEPREPPHWCIPRWGHLPTNGELRREMAAEIAKLLALLPWRALGPPTRLQTGLHRLIPDGGQGVAWAPSRGGDTGSHRQQTGDQTANSPGSPPHMLGWDLQERRHRECGCPKASTEPSPLSTQMPSVGARPDCRGGRADPIKSMNPQRKSPRSRWMQWWQGPRLRADVWGFLWGQAGSCHCWSPCFWLPLAFGRCPPPRQQGFF